MNMLLLRPDELDAAGRVTLADVRARHLLDVLGVAPGRQVRCGLWDGPLGTAVVAATTPTSVTVDCEFDATAPARGEDTLLLAVPRPKVLRRVVEHATALGYARIVLMRTWRVDKSHLDSRTIGAESLAPHVAAGLEQARRTRPPEIVVEPLFRPFVEDRLRLPTAPAIRIVADPDAPTDIATIRPRGAFTLAIGPERGFTPFELEMLGDAGFTAAHSGTHPLRVETAVAVLTGQLDLLRRLGAT